MAKNFGGTIKLQGESEYKKALSNITDNLKVLSSELKVVTSQYDKNDTSVKNLGSQNEVLNKKIAEQKEKVDILTKALSESKEETGENSNTTKKWQTELNNAQAELYKLEKTVDDNKKTMNESSEATDDNSKSIKDFGNEVDNSSPKVLKLGDIIKANLISDAIKSGLKSIVSGMKELGSTVIDVGKQALSSYADYEQLVGGVDTLFKDSSSKVQDYANNAYKTAGLSANEYMETVTSFSASLLQSLNGDTAKSAEVADMAITDMSDNANKMGTDMSMIQNAYQGFAKQNYTMLDNLKLGYGGTKTEMERLLEDATKISGVKYDINSLNDVYQAIHVIQGELGVTGTTSKEASTTIQGSVNSMKSAWQNMLTGIADDNANFGELVNNLINSIVTVGDNIIPRVEIIIQGIVDLIMSLSGRIVEYLPQLLETGMSLLQTIMNGITSMLPQLLPVVIQIITNLTTFIVDNLPTIIQAGIQILLALVQGIADSLPDLIPTLIDAILLIVETLIDNIDLIIDTGIKLIIGLANGLIKALPKLIEKIPIIIQKLINALTSNLPKLITMGITLTVELGKGLIKAIPELIKSVPQIIKSLVDGLKDGISKIKDVGKDLISGLWNGIKEMWDGLKDKVKDFGEGIVNKFKSVFGIHSPSKVFKEQIGTNLALGIGDGFSSTMNKVSKEMVNAIPTEFDISNNLKSTNLKNSDFNIDMQRGLPTTNNYENNTYNFYSPKDSPAEYARLIRKENQYKKLVMGSA